MPKVKASENKAKDVETPKVKRIDIPDSAKAEIARMQQNVNTYLAGVAAGLNIKGNWQFDARSMQFIVAEKTNGKKT